MAEDNTLTKALVDVRARRAALQSDYDRIAAELTKLRAAEAALTSIVEGIPLDASGLHAPEGRPRPPQPTAPPPADGAVLAVPGELSQGAAEGVARVGRPAGPVACEIAERLTDTSRPTLSTPISACW